MELLYDAAEAISGFMDSGPPLFEALFWIAVAVLPVTLVHELGHAFVARLLLGTDVEVRVGSAGKLAELRLGQVVAKINAIHQPGRPAGSAAFDDSRARAKDAVWIALAGPLASLAGVVLTAVLLSAAPARGLVHDLLWAAVLVGILGVLNLVPLELQESRDASPLRTDGRLVLDALKAAREPR